MASSLKGVLTESVFVLQDAGRLLYMGQNEWAHINCCLWSAEVYEENSALLQVHSAVSRGRHLVRHDQETNQI